MNINKKIQKTKDDKIKEEDGMTPELGAKDFNAKEAFKESLQQMKDMREGKIKKTTWDDFMKELKEEGYLD